MSDMNRNGEGACCERWPCVARAVSSVSTDFSHPTVFLLEELGSTHMCSQCASSMVNTAVRITKSTAVLLRLMMDSAAASITYTVEDRSSAAKAPKAALTTVEIRIHTKPKIIRPDI